ncbi:hypothetical protein E3N88_28752 [Mikania micrantha]|uniref:HAT C-terminal dimerisation domain-containing protein n=1 Tax=Mikania micrantha TaxID=192012 RepID=A0A5N6N0X7_9ASTR|nr:hypothetical protein E3N88_28752 [Mikania micrantha]
MTTHQSLCSSLSTIIEDHNCKECGSDSDKASTDKDSFFSEEDTRELDPTHGFNEETIELLSLSSSLASKEINVDEICLLLEKYYPQDFSDQENIQLRYQLEIFNIEKSKNINLSGASTTSDLCKSLVDTKKRETYYLVDRVIRLILTLSVSTATTERGFSAILGIHNR